MKRVEFLTAFKNYCDKIYGNDSGTANSYTNAVKYLFDYLNVVEVNEEVYNILKSLTPELKNKKTSFYKDLQNFYTKRGQSSYVKNGFLSAAINRLFNFIDNNFRLDLSVKKEILIEAVTDSDLKVIYDLNKLRSELPLCNQNEHDYKLSRNSGTVQETLKKIRSGRKAEKYFISYLKDFLGFAENKDFFDVANNKEYGYDIRLLNVGIEVKNIKSGGFYLTDNEIARIENTDTNLILVDVDNGIWLLKHDSVWLHNIIQNIKSIRKFCAKNYCNLDLTDIKINIDNEVNKEIFDISKLNKEQFKKILQI